MSLRDEELSENAFFQYFLSSAHYTAAAREQYLIAVPTTPSLAMIKFNKDFLETHILKKSPYYTDQYVTLNGKSVSLVDKELTCKNGFSKARTVIVTNEETYYDDDYQSFTVLRLNFPLEGVIAANYYKSVTDAAAIESADLYKRTIDEWESAICKYTSDSTIQPVPGGILIGCARFISQFNQSYVLVKGFINHAGLKCADAAGRLLNDAIARTKITHKEFAATRACASELSLAIECIIMAGIYKKLFAGLTELYAREEEMTQHRISQLRHLNQRQLGVRDDIECAPSAAIKALSQMGQFQTPLAKLGQLGEVAKLIQTAVAEQQTHGGDPLVVDHNKPRDGVLTAEDMIPLTCFVLLQSGLPHIHAHLHYLHNFHPNKTYATVDSLDVHFANFEAAVHLIDSGKLGNDSAIATNAPAISTSAALSGAVASLSVSVVPRTVASRHTRAHSNATAHNANAKAHSNVPPMNESPPNTPSNNVQRPMLTSLWTDEELNTAASPNAQSDDATRRTSRHAFTNTNTQSQSRSSRQSLTTPSSSRWSASAITTSSSSEALSAFYSVPTNEPNRSPQRSPNASTSHRRSRADDDGDDEKAGALGDFLSKLKKSDEVVTGKIRQLR